jgi:hypothetical protein
MKEEKKCVSVKEPPPLLFIGESVTAAVLKSTSRTLGKHLRGNRMPPHGRLR